MQEYYSNGKLLLTGEYLVLDGARALALPTKFGQSLTVESIAEPKIYWESISYQDKIWNEGIFSGFNEQKLNADNVDKYNQCLVQILLAAQQLNPKFLDDEKGFKVKTRLDFPLDWGLGSSSTLINNIAAWSRVDAYDLLELTFGGSGYDIACAQHDQALIYRLISNGRRIETVKFDPNFKDHLYFVYLNKKQNSRAAISDYNLKSNKSEHVISEINAITDAIIGTRTLEEFGSLIDQHERILSNCLQKSTIKDLYFNDFDGFIKSLGAWGGDFILAGSKDDPKSYFMQKGFQTIIDFEGMIL